MNSNHKIHRCVFRLAVLFCDTQINGHAKLASFSKKM